MAIMTAQLPLTLVPAGAIEIGQVAALVEDEAGGRVFVRGELVFAWDAGDDLGRRLAAVQLVRIKGARAVRVAAGFGVNTETLRRWEGAVTDVGVAALVSGKRGPKGPSRLSQEVVADIRSRRRSGASLRRRLRISATTSWLSREGPLGPRLPDTNAATPTSVTAPSQRRSVSVLTPKPAATRTARAPLIRTSCTAARRRPKSSPASHAKTSSPRTKTRPPAASSTKAATCPISIAPAGTRVRGS